MCFYIEKRNQLSITTKKPQQLNVCLLIYFVLRPHLCDLLLKDSMVQQIAISSRKKEENGNKSPEKKKKIAAVHFEPDIFAFCVQLLE